MSSNQKAQQIYDQLTRGSFTSQFPYPAPTCIVDVGTFYPDRNGGQGEFIGVKTAASDGVNTVLRFKVDPGDTSQCGVRTGQCYKIRDGGRYPTNTEWSSGRAGDTLTINCKRADEINWDIEATNRNGDAVRYADRLTVTHTRPMVGVGAFTVSVMPMAVVYAPPVDPTGRNVLAYTTSTSVGTALTTSFSSESSTTTPTPTGWEDLNTLRSAVGTVSKAVKNVPIVSTIVEGFSTFLGGLGNETASTTNGTVRAKDHSLIVEDTVSNSDILRTDAPPGRGDVIIFRKNVQVAWAFDGDQYDLKVLNDEAGSSAFTVQQLMDDYERMTGEKIPMSSQGQAPVYDPNEPTSGDPEFPPPPGNTSTSTRAHSAGPSKVLSAKVAHKLPRVRPPKVRETAPGQSGLSPEEIVSLLDLDPLVAGGEQAWLNPDRFVEADESPLEYGAHTKSVIFTHTITIQDAYGSTSFTTVMDKYTPGWLSCLGIGETENKTLVNTSKCLTSTRYSRGDTCQTNVTFDPQDDQFHCIHAYYDRAFGTFVFREGPIIETAAYQGTAYDASGSPAANRKVTLTVGGKTFHTVADAKGQYAFHSAEIPDGRGVLNVGKLRKNVVITRPNAIRPT